jgi:hypothetical protein
MSSATINNAPVASKRTREESIINLDNFDESVQSQMMALLQESKKKKEESPAPAVGTVTPKATIPPAECPPAPKKKSKKKEAEQQAPPPTEEDWISFARLTTACSDLSSKYRDKKNLGDRLISHMRTELGTDEHTVGDHVYKIRDMRRSPPLSTEYLKTVLEEHVDEETVQKILVSIDTRPKNVFYNLSVV